MSAVMQMLVAGASTFILNPTRRVGVRPASAIPSLTAAIDATGHTVTGSAQWPNTPWSVHYPFVAPVTTVRGFMSVNAVVCQFTIKLPAAASFNRFSFSAPSATYYRPASMQLYGSNDNVTFTLLEVMTGITAAEYPTNYTDHLILDFNNAGYYLYYKVNIDTWTAGSAGVYVQEATWSTR